MNEKRTIKAASKVAAELAEFETPWFQVEQRGLNSLFFANFKPALAPISDYGVLSPLN